MELILSLFFLLSNELFFPFGIVYPSNYFSPLNRLILGQCFYLFNMEIYFNIFIYERKSPFRLLPLSLWHKVSHFIPYHQIFYVNSLLKV